MSSLWRVDRRIVFDSDPAHITWPAQFELEICVTPGDYFGESSEDARVAILGSTEIKIDSVDGKLSIVESGVIEREVCTVNYPGGTLSFDGNLVGVAGELSNRSHLNSTVDWATNALTAFLSIETGIFFEVCSIEGHVGGVKCRAMHAAKQYSHHLTLAEPKVRAQRILQALEGPPQDSPSYNRFVVCARYFRHALRLLSPVWVLSPPYIHYPEVILNLAKTVESIYATSDRDKLRRGLAELDLSREEIDSQIISIIIIRNQLDVGHPSSTPLEPSDLETLRTFVDRSVQNVGSLLRKLKNKIAVTPDYLTQLSSNQDPDRARLLKTLQAHLQHPPIDDADDRPIVLRA